MPETARPFVTFAYGSNMASSRLQGRCKNSDLSTFEVARLPGYTLTFDKISRDGSGKATIAPDPEKQGEVWGVVFMVSQLDKQALDNAEGLGAGYHLQSLQMVTQSGRAIEAQAYIADDDRRDPLLKPYDWYIGCVVKGAVEHGLPDEYVAKLRAVPCMVDLDEARRQKNRC